MHLKKSVFIAAVLLSGVGFAAEGNCSNGRCEAPGQWKAPEGLSREKQTGPNNVPKQVPNNAPKSGIPQSKPAPSKLNPVAYSATTAIQWTTDYAAAVQQAQKQNKYILLFFTGSDWCGWCQKLKAEVFATSAFAQKVGNQFVFVELDYPMNRVMTPELTQQNRELKQKYGITGFPTVVILDSNENLIGQMGYESGGGESYANSLQKLIS